MATSESVLVTGGSGLLGREIMKKFRKENWQTFGTALNRAEKYNLLKVDLNDAAAVKQIVANTSPSIIIHSAAQRAPDIVENQYEEAKKLNVTATKNLADIADTHKIPVIYISTDYVFDGKNPPYKESDTPNPVNKYGITKLDGEKMILNTNSDNIVFRVPVLYGEVEYPGESAVTCLLDAILSGNPQEVSDYEIRWPAHTADIAAMCFELSKRKLTDPNVAGIYQWSGMEGLTKYRMIQIIAEEMKLSTDHIRPNNQENKSVARPYNCQLDSSRLKGLVVIQQRNFREGIKECLSKFIP